MTDIAQTQQAVAYKLMDDILQARGKGTYPSTHNNAATDKEIRAAFEEAAELVNLVFRNSTS